MYAHLQEPGKSVEATLRGNVPTREIYVSWNVKSPNWQFNMFLLCLKVRAEADFKKPADLSSWKSNELHFYV